MKTQSLKLSLIRCDSGTQTRCYTNEDSVAEYAERMLEGDKFPPVDVFFDGTEYHLGDGFHRVMGANRNEFKDILANVHKGTAIDAIWFGIGANKTNGVKRSSGDVRKSIEIALTKFPEKTQEQISQQVGCSRDYVSKVQKELVTNHKLTLPATRKGKDGKSRPTKYAKAKTESATQPEPVEAETVNPIEHQQQEARNALKGIVIPPEPSARNNAISDFETLFSEHLPALSTIHDLKAFRLTIQVGLAKIDAKLKAVRLEEAA